jgi:hypothetical protein
MILQKVRKKNQQIWSYYDQEIPFEILIVD